MLRTLRIGLLGLLGVVLGVAGLVLPVTSATAAPAATAAAEEPGTDPDALDPHEDPALVVADDGTLFARDRWTAPAQAPAQETTFASTAALASYSPAEAFTLHSAPGAARTIYLDFDGGSLLSTNSWLSNGLTTLLYPGWSTDSSASFSDAERAVVIEVWSRMAEDVAPFAIDVTTQEPPATDLWRASSSDARYGTRVAFTSGTGVQDALCGGSCGGVAWIGTFDSVTNGEVRSPAWVFPGSLGNRAKNLADAGSHEAGHNLGLGHDGITSSAYYGGTSLWGPLMGGPYSASITQWSRGSYAGANNSEDDLAVAASNGAPLRADEAGSSVATALPRPSLPGGQGVITSQADEDWLTVIGCSGTVTAQASPVSIGANLDIGLEVRNAAGTVLSSAAPQTSRTTSGVTGMGASISLPLSGGPFHIAVSGVGSGSGGLAGWTSGGYDDYASLGAYQLTVTGCTNKEPVVEPPPADPTPTPTPTPTPEVEPQVEPQVEQPPVVPTATRPSAPARPLASAGAYGGTRTLVARWSAPTSTGGATINGYVVVAYRFSSTGRVVSIVTSRVQGSTVRRLEMALPYGRWAVRVKARNRLGWSATSPLSARVTPR